MIKRLAIIPARSGSKRIKNKNIKNFLGKPIIYYAIDSLKKSKLFSRIHVSTDSNKIKNIVNKKNLKINRLRPKKLSSDSAPTMEVLKYELKKFLELNEKYDEVWLISACNPLLQIKDLKNAAKKFNLKKNRLSLIAVTDYAAPIEWAFEIKNNKLIPVQKNMFKVRSNKLTEKFYDCDSFAIFKPNEILSSSKYGTNARFVPYKITRELAVDIDNLRDWKYAEKLYKLI
jgi:N-acylneuraminate cytidylyltransferase